MREITCALSSFNLTPTRGDDNDYNYAACDLGADQHVFVVKKKKKNEKKVI